MNPDHPRPKVKAQRKFVSPNLNIDSWGSVEMYFTDLLTRNINSVANLEKWLSDRSELSSVLEEDLAWRYIRMNCNTSDKELTKNYEDFVKDIEPEASRMSNLLDRKFFNTTIIDQLDTKKYLVFIRALKKRMEIFREENVPILSELQVEEQLYGKITSGMTVTHDGKELTLQEASNYIKDPDRNIRKDFYFRITKRRLKDAVKLQELLSSLIGKRHEVALNAGFENYMDYKWADFGRFDYSVEDCKRFHESIATEVCPLADWILERRIEKLNIQTLKPWDLEVDIDLKPPLKPFRDSSELITKTVKCFGKIRSRFGDYLQQMENGGFLDLDSRINKAPGGFNYPLYESNIPFIFMNATGNLRDLETMFHEGGHAVHSFVSAGQELVEYKELPAEVAELASMTMELISMDHWHNFFRSKEDLNRAKRSQLEGIIQVLPWIATIDKFQHWLYTNPEHSHDERNSAWKNVMAEFGSKQVDWKGLEDQLANMWQKQLHIFEVPFYYVEYGIAQLGAIAIWKNYRDNPVKALDLYEKALSLGYSVPIRGIYQTAGISFDFSREYVQELIGFVSGELERLI